MDTLRKNLEPQFDQCLPSIKADFKILIDNILNEADKVDVEENYNERIKGIYRVMHDAEKIFTLDRDMKKLLYKK